MKKAFYKVIAVIVCISCLMTSVAVGASAAVETDCNGDCGHSPVIVLPGINHSPTYLYDENDNPVMNGDSQVGGSLLILNETALDTNTIIEACVRVLLTIFCQYNVGIDDFAYDLVSELFKYQRCDENGDHVENLKTQRWNYSLDKMSEEDIEWTYRMVPIKSLVDEIGGDHVYFFTFNLVGDPMDSADDLQEYIDMVKEQTGHDKVILLPVSLGGTILTAYLDKYGHDDLDQIVNAVACLNGTDIVADFFAREWRLDDEYLYHEFIAQIFVESEGSATLGYLINTLLHILPRSGINALLTGAMSGILDTLMLNCPQFWAMLPSYRYEALAERYLSDQPDLKSRTDRFQQARLNLNQNILDAVADGVRVNSIAGANLDLGEEMYTYFNIVASAEKVNSDGIINLSSTTLGATGAPGSLTLSDIDYEKNTYCTDPTHNHISPDNMVDASTSILPENTWIFLNQHHEVGYNDVVLNLAKAIILGEVTDVNDNPEMYPQFNGTCYTQSLRRWKLPDAKKVDQSKLSEEDKNELNAAIAEAEAVLNMTITDQERVEKAENNLIAVLHKVGAEGYENIETEEESALDPILESLTCAMSKASLALFGGGSPTDRLLYPARKLIELIAGDSI